MMLPKSLMNELRTRQVRIDVLDTDTLMLRRVPIQVDAFNKPVTNLLLKRPAPGMPYLALVDESLTYTGSDPDIETAFPANAGHQGWRALSLNVAADRDAANVLQNALRVLGFDRPSAPPAQEPQPAPPRLLERFGRPMRDRHGVTETIGRNDEITEIIACLRRLGPCMPLIVGGPGSGKTNVLHAVVRRLNELHRDQNVVEINLMDVLSATGPGGRTRCLFELLEEVAESHTVVAIEHVELLVELADIGPLLLSRALDDGAKIIGTLPRGSIENFNHSELARRVQLIRLPELHRDVVVQILLNARAAYRVEIQESTAVTCIRAAKDLPGRFPGKAIALLDAAASFAVAIGAEVVSPDDIYCAAQKLGPPSEPRRGE